MKFINCEYDEIYDCPEEYINPSNEIWTTKEGQEIRIGDMTNDHIRNCYNMVVKAQNAYWQRVFKAELYKRKIREDCLIVSVDFSPYDKDYMVVTRRNGDTTYVVNILTDDKAVEIYNKLIGKDK